MKCAVYETQNTNPWHNLAAEQLLLNLVEPDQVILYLWQNEHTVVIGRNQNAWRECRLEALEADGGKLARRLSGGGAVYHDKGNQNFTFITRKANHSLEKQTEVIRLAVQAFGIEAVRSGRNDILATGRKFSGNAFYRSGDFCYHHGTILMNSDMARMGKYLNPLPEKLAGKGVTSVQARVINLCELAENITPKAMRAALVKAFGMVYRAQVEPLVQSTLPTEQWEALTAHYSSKDWRLGPPFPYTARYGRRLSFGEVEVLLCAKAGVVAEAKIYTDAMTTEWVDEVAKALSGAKLENDALQGRLSSLSGQVETDVLVELAALTEAYFLKEF